MHLPHFSRRNWKYLSGVHEDEQWAIYLTDGNLTAE